MEDLFRARASDIVDKAARKFRELTQFSLRYGMFGIVRCARFSITPTLRVHVCARACNAQCVLHCTALRGTARLACKPTGLGVFCSRPCAVPSPPPSPGGRLQRVQARSGARAVLGLWRHPRAGHQCGVGRPSSRLHVVPGRCEVRGRVRESVCARNFCMHAQWARVSRAQISSPGVLTETHAPVCVRARTRTRPCAGQVPCL
jgi:hypothetical protein